MDQGEKLEKARNPREKASIFSIIFFYFTAPILKKGRKRDLQEKDIYQVLSKFESDKLGNKLESKWNETINRSKNSNPINKENLEKNGYKTLDADVNNKTENFHDNNENKNGEESIFWCLFKRFGFYYFLLGFMQLIIRVGETLIQPIIFSKFTAYFQPGQNEITKQDAYFYAFSLIGLNVFITIYNHNYQQQIMEYSIKVRTSLCSLIYRKALKINSISSSDYTMGKIVTLITKDVYAIDGALLYFNDIWVGAIQAIIVTIMLYNRIGSSVFVGIGFFLAVIPIQAYCGWKFSLTRLVAAKKAEDRIQLLTEALNAIKIIKMYTWEKYFEKLITAARIKETDKLKIIYYLKATIIILAALALKVAFCLLILTYTFIGKSVNAETVYFIQQSFQRLRFFISFSIAIGINNISELYAAMKRFQHYFNAPEYVPPENIHQFQKTKNPKIYLNKISVKINGKKILRSVSLEHKNAGLLLVSGNIGSGKSSLLKTILNEYPVSSGEISIRGTISYAPEEPWIFPSTIRQNILFGQSYDERRYLEVLRVCALNHDLNLLKKLDNTVVGDKGINLSQGQKSRICLARAIYKKSDIYLLDDCLSSLDGYVNNYVFKECIREFLKDKLVLFVNNNINNIKKLPTESILFMENGKTLNLDEQKTALDKRITYYMDEDNEYLDEDEENYTDETAELLMTKEEPTEPKRNLYHEKNKKGSVLWKNYLTYYRFTGGFMVLVLILILFLICQFTLSYSEKLLSLWVNNGATVTNLIKKNETNNNSTSELKVAIDKRDRNLSLFALMLLAGVILTLIRSFSNFFFCARAGRKLHKVLILGVLNTCMSFFDTHYIGNVINRVSKDFYTIDENIPFIIYEILRSFFQVIAVIILIATVNYYFLIIATILIINLIWMQRYYIPTGRSLKRLDAATRSPMIGYINASLEGLTTVRACREERILQSEFDKHQDLFTSTFYMSQSAQRAFAFSLDMLCLAFSACITLGCLMFLQNVKPGDVGLAVGQAASLLGLLQWGVKQTAEMENTMTAVERVLEYAEAEPERKFGEKLIHWPKIGKIIYQDVSLQYKTTGEQVLNNINFTIEGKNKIGIVGRTGAGKTSIISALFRLYDYDGIISIDGVNVKTLDLDQLRSSIGIIPQDPILFRGTIRSNIDPLNKYSDNEIWSAIENVQMKRLILSLDQEITDHGENFSSGQRQLICLARALVWKNKIVVLDEATANLDLQTDQLLQKTMQNHFADCTVLIIAHRLQSLQVVDKILVVEDGKIVQYDNPELLLHQKDGLFYKMVQDSSGLHVL